jgi:hypothetical protein
MDSSRWTYLNLLRHERSSMERLEADIRQGLSGIERFSSDFSENRRIRMQFERVMSEIVLLVTELKLGPDYRSSTTSVAEGFPAQFNFSREKLETGLSKVENKELSLNRSVGTRGAMRARLVAILNEHQAPLKSKEIIWLEVATQSIPCLSLHRFGSFQFDDFTSYFNRSSGGLLQAPAKELPYGAISPWVVPALDAKDYSAIRDRFTLSDWPLVKRILPAGSERLCQLRVILRLMTLISGFSDDRSNGIIRTKLEGVLDAAIAKTGRTHSRDWGMSDLRREIDHLERETHSDLMKAEARIRQSPEIDRFWGADYRDGFKSAIARGSRLK